MHQINGISFGETLRNLRLQAGIKSRDLSQRIGKAITYVSQLERGLIKKVDYDICYKLLKEVGWDDQRIVDTMEWFNVETEDLLRKEREIERYLEEQERLANDDDYYDRMLEQQLEFERVRLKDHNDTIHHKLNLLVERDLSKAEILLLNMELLTRNKEDLDFLCSLFTHNFATLNPEQKQELLQLIDGFVAKSKQQTKEDEA